MLIKIFSRLSLSHPSSESLELLVEACDPATFGKNKEDVYDESYRKAMKLNAGSFVVGLDVVRLGLIEIIRENLILGEESGRPVRAELYNLNVYGHYIHTRLDIVLLTMMLQAKDLFSRRMSIHLAACRCLVLSSSYFRLPSKVASLS